MTDVNPLNELKELSAPVAAEVVREGELMLQSQFAASFAADQRALSFAAIAITGAAAIIGVVITGDPPKVSIDYAALVGIALFMATAMIVSAVMAIDAALPSRFQFPGNEPDNWRPSQWVETNPEKRSLSQARLEQAMALQYAINTNRLIATRQAKRIRYAVWLTFGSVGMGLCLYMGLFLWSLAFP